MALFKSRAGDNNKVAAYDLEQNAGPDDGLASENGTVIGRVWSIA